MATVRVKINNRDYALACDDGQEEQLRLLADEVDDRVRALIFRMGSNPGEAMALLLAAVTMADELIENKKEIEHLAKQLRIASSQLEKLKAGSGDSRLNEMEDAMAATLEEISLRIEKIAERIEIR